jgi:N-acetylneuraminic acid mutarotase
LFGGFHDYEVLSTIEKYDSVLDNCLTLYVKLPQPLAKLGVVALDGQRQIAIVGGMNGTFHRQKGLNIFDLKTTKWQTMAEMKIAKTFNGNVHYNDGFVYALGGNDKD